MIDSTLIDCWVSIFPLFLKLSMILIFFFELIVSVFSADYSLSKHKSADLFKFPRLGDWMWCRRLKCARRKDKQGKGTPKEKVVSCKHKKSQNVQIVWSLVGKEVVQRGSKMRTNRSDAKEVADRTKNRKVCEAMREINAAVRCCVEASVVRNGIRLHGSPIERV